MADEVARGLFVGISASAGETAFEIDDPMSDVIFYDTFTSEVTENLTSHTPDIGTSWLLDPDVTAQVAGGEVSTTAAIAPSAAYVSDSVTAERTVKFQVGAAPGVTGAVTRHQDGANFIGVQYIHATGLLRLVRVLAGSLVSLIQSTRSLSPADVVEITDDGATVAVYVNGVETIPGQGVANFSANPAAGIFVAAANGNLTAFAAVGVIEATGAMP